jgi:hypothetical protein
MHENNCLELPQISKIDEQTQAYLRRRCVSDGRRRKSCKRRQQEPHPSESITTPKPEVEEPAGNYEKTGDDGDNDLEGSVTEEDPPEVLFGDDVEEDGHAVLAKRVKNSVGKKGLARASANENQFVDEPNDGPVGDASANSDIYGNAAAAGRVQPDASVDELLSEPASSRMAGADKEYKDLIAESQLDNIFN